MQVTIDNYEKKLTKGSRSNQLELGNLPENRVPNQNVKGEVIEVIAKTGTKVLGSDDIEIVPIIKDEEILRNGLKPKTNLNEKEKETKKEPEKKNIFSSIDPKTAVLSQIKSDDPMDYLRIAKEAIVYQYQDRYVFLHSCEPPVRYMVDIVTYRGEVKTIFKCREVPKWFQKHCVPANGRSYKIEIENVLEEENEADITYVNSISSNSEKEKEKDNKRKMEQKKQLEQEGIAHNHDHNHQTHDNNDNSSVKSKPPDDIHKEIKMYGSIGKPSKCCTAFQAKPDLLIQTINPITLIGKLKEPWACSFIMNLTDKDDDLRYRIDASAGQCGIAWRGSVFGKCAEVFFPIFKPDNNSRLQEKSDGLIRKKHSACYKTEVVENADSVIVTFPVDCTVEDKYLILCTGLIIDYRFYEENPFEIVAEKELE